MKSFIFFKIAITVLLFSFTEKFNAQIAIGKPNLGFTQACASDSFNTFNVTFSFSPEANLDGTNQFIIELSDESGSFTNATDIYKTVPGAVTTSPVRIPFSFPTSVSGEGYRIRIKSTSPSVMGSLSDVFAAYYKLQDTPFSINNLIETGIYCSGGSYLLTIDNPGGPTNDSPLQYPSLTFNWFKETSPTTSVFVSTGATLSVNAPGTYFAETNYGTCTSNSFSNRVTVSESGTGTTTSTINSSLGNPYCLNEGATTLSAINGNSYQWYKDGNEISGATNQKYITNEAGEYSVNIDLGDCMASASITLENTGFSSVIDAEDVNTIDEGDSLLVMVTDDAMNSEYEWYFNDDLIIGETDNNYNINEIGDYKVIVKQTSGCIASSTFSFKVKHPFLLKDIPNLISPNNDGYNDTWNIPEEYLSGTDTEVIIINPQGKVVLQTKDFNNDVWPSINQIDFKSVNPVYYYIITTADNKTRKGSITIIK